MSNKYVCVHGHFYQPPRENPWLEYVERQLSAYPYHDWNERITAECYAPNTAARILDDAGRVSEIFDNYEHISFNIGPTLLSWMQTRKPQVYERILEADEASQRRFSGHGSALAQAHGHLIMPLCNRRDKVTQVRWGVADFEYRYGRKPEGMWLPETAVDLESLEVLAEHGIAFTILAPHQAKRVRKIGTRGWTDVDGGRIDPSMPYVQPLPSGKKIAIFFYDGPTSRAVAFEGLLNDGVRFGERLTSVFCDKDNPAQLSHIATDGESYGHHHRYGEMALAYALYHIEHNGLARLTNYGEFLSLHPPTHEVEIHENTSWSCAHGIERWRSDCGCKTGSKPTWNQAWRTPLRKSLDWLRDELAPMYEQQAAELFANPWATRDAYIEVVLERSPERLVDFWREHAKTELSGEAEMTALRLLEMQRHAMLMFTSCGWFFDDLAGIETVQNLRYAARAMQLAREVTGRDLEPEFLARLSEGRSNAASEGDGRRIYENRVKTTQVELEKVAAHYAIRSLFEAAEEQEQVYCYDIERHDYQSFAAGSARAALGRVSVRSRITADEQQLCFSVLHFGDHTINCGVHRFRSEDSFQTLNERVAEAFLSADVARVVRVLDEHFERLPYTIGALFRDEQRRILDLVLQQRVDSTEETLETLHVQHAPLLRFLNQFDLPVPPALHLASGFVLNMRLRAALEADTLDLEEIYRLLEEAEATAVKLDEVSLAFALERSLESGLRGLLTRPGDLGELQALVDVTSLLVRVPFKVDLTGSQNVYYELLSRTYPSYKDKGERGDEHAQGWLSRFHALGEALGVRAA